MKRLLKSLILFCFSQVNPKENLPQQICDLCIVQLNVSYNFKRLALKNDFQIRQYMIENGMSLSKDDEEGIETTTTALEIHQIHHNVIRTDRYRRITAPLNAPEIRRNSTMILNGRENDVGTSNITNFVTPRPIVRPIQIKSEPVDPDEENKDESPVTSSPSNASEPSIVTVSSTNRNEKQATPMIVINGIINKESFNEKSSEPPSTSRPAPLSVKNQRSRKMNENQKTNQNLHNLRTIQKKATDVVKVRKKLRRTVKLIDQKVLRKNQKKEAEKMEKRPIGRPAKKSTAIAQQKPRGRPRKIPGAPKMTYKKRKNDKTKS